MRVLRDNQSKEKEKEAREKNRIIKTRSRTVVEYTEGLARKYLKVSIKFLILRTLKIALERWMLFANFAGH